MNRMRTMTGGSRLVVPGAVHERAGDGGYGRLAGLAPLYKMGDSFSALVLIHRVLLSCSAGSVEDPVPVGAQPSQVRRPVSEGLRWPRLLGEPANAFPERGDTSRIVAEEARCQVESADLPVDLVAHREDMPRRRPASSCET